MGTTKKSGKKTAKKPRTALPHVLLVGIEGAPLDAVFEGLSAGAAPLEVSDPRVRACEWEAGAQRSMLVRVPGMQTERGVSQQEQLARWNAGEDVFELLLDLLPKARVVLHVVSAYASDPEADAAEVDSTIYGMAHDTHASIEVLFAHDERPIDPAKQAAFFNAYPKARKLSLRGKSALAAIQALVEEHLRSEHTGLALPEDASGFGLEQFELQALQLELLRRTCSGGFDGALVYGSLIALDGVLSVVASRFLRTRYAENAAPERSKNGLAHLAGLKKNRWEANTLHVQMDSAKGAKKVRALARDAWGANYTSLRDDHVVVARWKPRLRPTVQELQLELLRRTSFNAFRGDRIYTWLLAHRELWSAVLLGRQNEQVLLEDQWAPDRALLNGVKELPEGYWSADHLWLLATDEAAAKLLARAGELHWFADRATIYSEADTRKTAGTEPPQRVLEFWWD